MKCLILAGGHGERLWPLSRKNYPKQFIEIQKNHSIFQETVARNIPYCDEFIIVTSYEYRFIVANQMKVFQGTPYRCVFEENPRKTTAAILLACLDLQPLEYVFVVAADHLIDTKMETVGDRLSYKDAILKAKAYARESSIVLFGQEETEPDSRFGYIQSIDAQCRVKHFCEKPKGSVAEQLKKNGQLYRSLGLMLFQNGTLQEELSRYAPQLVNQCRHAYGLRRMIGGDAYYSAQVQSVLEPVPIENSLVEKTKKLRAIPVGFGWQDIGSLEDLGKTYIQSNGLVVTEGCSNALVINKKTKQAVVVNGLDDVMVVNTPDAIYIGKYGISKELKEILHNHQELDPYAEKSTVYYRSWGMYERYVEEPDYRVQQITLLPGKTIYQHRHMYRSESWQVIRGSVLVDIDGEKRIYGPRDRVDAPVGSKHQISNVGDRPAILLETAIGEMLQDMDMIGNPVADMVETQLGYVADPMIRMKPVFKDALWGGTKLRDIYRKNCDYDVISESWELSAHPEGQSIIDSGRHAGMKFGKYLDTVGKEVLGWKCDPLQSFPMLIKFIDAKKDLSVQVHPDDDYALEKENQYGKNEMWYVVDAEPGAGLYVGFNRDLTREEVASRIKNNTIMEVLNFYPTKPGEVFFIPAGTVHAIGAGNLICEIQQSSSCTYRLYDYDRRDKFGRKRELHLEKALDVLNLQKYIPEEHPVGSEQPGRLLGRCKYFESVLMEVQGLEKFPLGSDRFTALVCISGKGTLAMDSMQLDIRAGECIFIPAQENVLTITGELKVILCYI